MARRKNKNKTGLSANDIRSLINKSSGTEMAFNLKDENPTDVVDWIPTGSRWLDSMICRGKMAGIPVGKVSEIAGLSGAGKSYMAAVISANAQKKGIKVVYFDSESALDSVFLTNAGCDVDELIYVQPEHVEGVLETIEAILASSNDRFLFVWDSLAFTPSVADLEGDYNPQSSMAVKPRILAKGLPKLLTPLANSQSTLLVLNQLKTNITRNTAEAMTTPYVAPGGKALVYSYSLRVWLTGRKAKISFIYDDKGYKIGSEVKVKLEKSRFGSQGRQCAFKILWGDEVKIQDEESWLEAVKPSEHIKQSGAWYTLVMADGSEMKFQSAHWVDKLQNEAFRERVLEIMDEEVITKFKNRTGDASNYYNISEEEEEE